MTTTLQPIDPAKTSLIIKRGDDLEVSAFQPQEMRDANVALISWCEQKIDALKREAADLLEAYKQAVAKKWKSSTLKRHADLAEKRVTFYSKMKSALEHGYYIVPNFPVTCFAIRTDRKSPLKMLGYIHWENKEQKCGMLPAGEGEYQNPFPVIFKRDVTSAEQRAQKKEVIQYFAEKWDDLEFPIMMAKPHIMEATTRAMALKIFDDFGILPGHKKEDPIIVGRIKDPRSGSYTSQTRFISFIIAWHLDTRTI